MSFTESIRTWHIRRLNRIANQTCLEIQLISLYRLQLEFQLPSHEKESETNEKELIQSVVSFYDWELSSEIRAKSSPEFRYLHWLCNDDESKSLRELAFRISHWLSTSEEDRNDIEQTFRDVFESDMNPLTDAEISKLHRRFRKKKKHMRRQWKDSGGDKIDLRLKDIAMVIPLVSAALICAGYLHTSIVYTHFGIDPTRFFSVGDYLASSLEQIRLVLFSLIGFIVGVVYRCRKPSIQTNYEKEAENYRRQILNYFLYAIIVLGISAALLNWERASTIPGINLYLVVGFLVVIESPLARLVNRYFNNSQSVYLATLVLAIFFGSMYIGAHTRISFLKSEQTKPAYQVVSRQNSYTHNNSRIIGANSRYMFIWDRKEKVEVIPLSQIDRATFSENQIVIKNNFPADINGP